jgi:hypothetical protein
MLDWMILKTLARLCMIGLALALTSCAAVVDSEGAKVGDPVRFAQATATDAVWRDKGGDEYR